VYFHAGGGKGQRHATGADAQLQRSIAMSKLGE